MAFEFQRNPWTNVYGTARSILAFGTLLTFLFHDTNVLFKPTGQFAPLPKAAIVAKLSLFHLISPQYLEIARWIAIIILLVVISGWRPRITGLPHWWVTFSFATSAIAIEGGDQISAVLTLLLLPVALTDPRKWHWSTLKNENPTLKFKIFALLAISSLFVIRLQVSLIYFNAGVAKLNVSEWKNGTALYYWFTHKIFGVSPWLEPVLMPLLTNSVSVTFLTWGTIALEILLFMALVMDKRWWPVMLKVGLLFHFGIIVIHGLVTFFFAMAGALILYLRPFELQFVFLETTLKKIKNFILLQPKPIRTFFQRSKK